MPTYEYACDACGNGFEVVQKMADEPVKTCPECGKAVRRVLSGGIGISFRGSGFYVTDSGAAASGTKAEKKPAPAACGSGGSCPGCSGA